MRTKVVEEFGNLRTGDNTGIRAALKDEIAHAMRADLSADAVCLLHNFNVAAPFSGVKCGGKSRQSGADHHHIAGS